MLEVTSLSKSFDGFKAVNNAGLSVKDGEIVAVIGPNGAGKTTFFNLITGVIRPDSGKVLNSQVPSMAVDDISSAAAGA